MRLCCCEQKLLAFSHRYFYCWLLQRQWSALSLCCSGADGLKATRQSGFLGTCWRYPWRRYRTQSRLMDARPVWHRVSGRLPHPLYCRLHWHLRNAVHSLPSRAKDSTLTLWWAPLKRDSSSACICGCHYWCCLRLWSHEPADGCHTISNADLRSAVLGYRSSFGVACDRHVCSWIFYRIAYSKIWDIKDHGGRSAAELHLYRHCTYWNGPASILYCTIFTRCRLELFIYRRYIFGNDRLST